MTRFVYATATSLDGYLADEAGSLDWLFAVGGGDETIAELSAWVAGVSVLVMGSTTYEWVLREERLLEQPAKWQQFYEDRKTFVLTSRAATIARVPGADIEYVGGPVGDHIDAILAASGGRDVWVMGGGDVAAQFAEAGRLDEIRLSIAPVVLTAGAPLFGGRLESDRLRLVETHRTGEFVQVTYAVGPGA